MSEHFLKVVANRRSHYAIGNVAVTSTKRIIEILEQAVLHSPSAYNSQSTRVVLLMGEHHDKLWDLLIEVMRNKLSPERFPETEKKLNGFKAGYGTVMFFEDMDAVQELIDKFPTYKENFLSWSLQGAGIMEYVVWTALEAEGYGASLQHYNELIGDAVAKEWNLPASWKLNAQMPFGNITAAPEEKTFLPLEGRLTIFR